jgi:hypothetical protein
MILQENEAVAVGSCTGQLRTTQMRKQLLPSEASKESVASTTSSILSAGTPDNRRFTESEGALATSKSTTISVDSVSQRSTMGVCTGREGWGILVALTIALASGMAFQGLSTPAVNLVVVVTALGGAKESLRDSCLKRGLPSLAFESLLLRLLVVFFDVLVGVVLLLLLLLLPLALVLALVLVLELVLNLVLVLLLLLVPILSLLLVRLYALAMPERCCHCT